MEKFLAQLAQSLAELNSHIRNGAGGVITDFANDVKGQLHSWSGRKGLSYRPAVISLSAECGLTGAGTASGGTASVRMSANENFVVHSIRGFIVMNALPTEPVLVTGALAAYGATTAPSERLKMKAQNCRVILSNADTKTPIMENEGISMSSITPEAGGMPLYFAPDIVPAFIIPQNYTLSAQFVFQSVTYPFNTASSNYGIALTGAYIQPNA